MSTGCPTCGDEVMQERWELGLHYCLRPQCVQANHQDLVIMEIGQTKTNAEYVILTPEKREALAQGRYRRDPVVVKRETTRGIVAPLRKQEHETRFQLYLYEPRLRRWLLKQSFTDQGEAGEHAEMYRHKGRRARLMIKKGDA